MSQPPRQQPTPAIVVIGGEHRDAILTELGSRYARDYDLIAPETAAEGKALMKERMASWYPVAMIACELQTPTHTALEVFDYLQPVMNTARRIVLVPMADFRAAAVMLRESLAEGRIDGYFVLPQGPRDEEFHTGITDLLSEWNWSSGSVAVDVARVVVDGRPNADVARIRDFLDRMGIAHRVFAVDTDAGRELVAAAGPDPRYPLVQAMHGPVLANPTLAQLGGLMYGSPSDLDPTEVHDLVIVGAGPAGLAAAVYGASEGLTSLAVDAEAIGGQAGTSSMIRNYLGFPRGISGMRLAQRARTQATRFGARFLAGWQVVGLEPATAADPTHTVRFTGAAVRARTVLISSGVRYRRLGVPGLEDLVGRGVHYGAATSTAREMKHKHVYVVGGGNSAGQAALHLSRFAASVTLCLRRPDLTATMSEYLVREIGGNRRITLRPRIAVIDGGGEGHLEWLRLRDLDTGTEEEVPAKGLYLLLGAEPHCAWLPDAVALDHHGFVLAGADTPRETWPGPKPPPPFATTVPGVFVAGDVRAGSIKRVAAASGEGSAVIPLVHAYLADLASGFTRLGR